MSKIEVGGIYEHYKGHKYFVLTTGKHSETLEEMVVYIALFEGEKGVVWCRPASMWNEEVEYQGKKVSRFSLVTPSGGQ